MRFFRIPAFTGIETHRDDADRGSLRVVEGCLPHGPGGLRSGPVWEDVGTVDIVSVDEENHLTAADDGNGNSMLFVSRLDEVHDMAIMSTEHTEVGTFGDTYSVVDPVDLYEQGRAILTPVGSRLFAFGDGDGEAVFTGKGPPAIQDTKIFPDARLYSFEWARFPNCNFFVQGPKKTLFAAGNPARPLTVYISEPAGKTKPYRDSPYSTEAPAGDAYAGQLSTVDILMSNASRITGLSSRGDQVVVHTDKGCHILYAPTGDQANTGYRVEQVAATNFSAAVNHQVVAGETGSMSFWLGHDGQIYKDESASRGAEDAKSFTDPDQASWKAKGLWEKELPVDLSQSFSAYDRESGMYWLFVRSDEYNKAAEDDAPGRAIHVEATPDPPAEVGSFTALPDVPGTINLTALPDMPGEPSDLEAIPVPGQVDGLTALPDAPGIVEGLDALGKPGDVSDLEALPDQPGIVDLNAIPDLPGSTSDLEALPDIPGTVNITASPDEPGNIGSFSAIPDLPGEVTGLTVVIEDIQLPKPVIVDELEDANNDSLDVFIDAIDPNAGKADGSQKLEYQVSQHGLFTNIESDGYATTTPFTVPNLTPSTIYYIRVKQLGFCQEIRGGVGPCYLDSEWSIPLFFQSSDDPPGIVGNLSASPDVPGAVNLTAEPDFPGIVTGLTAEPEAFDFSIYTHDDAFVMTGDVGTGTIGILNRPRQWFHQQWDPYYGNGPTTEAQLDLPNNISGSTQAEMTEYHPKAVAATIGFNMGIMSGSVPNMQNNNFRMVWSNCKYIGLMDMNDINRTADGSLHPDASYFTFKSTINGTTPAWYQEAINEFGAKWVVYLMYDPLVSRYRVFASRKNSLGHILRSGSGDSLHFIDKVNNYTGAYDQYNPFGSYNFHYPVDSLVYGFTWLAGFNPTDYTWTPTVDEAARGVAQFQTHTGQTLAIELRTGRALDSSGNVI